MKLRGATCGDRGAGGGEVGADVVLLVVGAELAVLRVDVLAGGDRLRRVADDLAELGDGAAERDVLAGDLVAGHDRRGERRRPRPSGREPCGARAVRIATLSDGAEDQGRGGVEHGLGLRVRRHVHAYRARRAVCHPATRATDGPGAVGEQAGVGGGDGRRGSRRSAASVAREDLADAEQRRDPASGPPAPRRRAPSGGRPAGRGRRSRWPRLVHAADVAHPGGDGEGRGRGRGARRRGCRRWCRGCAAAASG